ncbi:hypothetical protein GDO81_028432 [Engystomops pustulosus]|uniref:Uncharacterized protein n=1 Tax=Engystomops pustulosus TaxID=76066 RepID=A0AAV6YIP3_ENGPU|nr:hypothetical protein GDO81_028432 [Engystomops pustulosus]
MCKFGDMFPFNIRYALTVDPFAYRVTHFFSPQINCSWDVKQLCLLSLLPKFNSFFSIALQLAKCHSRNSMDLLEGRGCCSQRRKSCDRALCM